MTQSNEDILKQLNRSIITLDALAKIPGASGQAAKQRAKDLRQERKQLQQTMGIYPTQSVTHS